MDRIRDCFRQILGPADHPAWLLSAAGDLLCANEAAGRLLGFPESGGDGPSSPGSLAPANAARMSEARAALLDGRTDHVALALAFPTESGGTREIECRLRLLHHEGDVAAILCEASADRSAAPLPAPETQPKACRTLRQYQILQSAAATAGFALWYMDLSTGRIWATDNFYPLLGHGPDEIALDGTWVKERLHPTDREAARTAVDRLVAREINAFTLDCRLLAKDGTWKWFGIAGHMAPPAAEAADPVICGSLIDIDARKATEARLAVALEEAEQARAQAQASEEMLRISAICGEIVPWNFCLDRDQVWFLDVAYRQLGYEPGEVPSSKEAWQHLVHPDDLAASTALMEDVIAGRTPVYTMDLRLRHKDGHYHWYRSRARKIDRSSQNLPDLIAGALTCIDEPKEAQSRLAAAAAAARHASRRLNTLADNAPGALFEFRQDRTGAIDFPYFSAKLPGLFGLSREEMEADGSSFFPLIHPDDIEPVKATIEQSRQTLSIFEARFRVNHPEAGERWLMASSLPFPQPDGSVIWYGNVNDITDRVEADMRAAEAAEAVQAAHQRLSSIADTAPIGIFEYRHHPDGTTDFPYTSRNFETLVGFTRRQIEMLGDVLLSRVHPADFPGFMASVEESARTLSPWSGRFRMIHPEDGLRWLAGASTPRRAPNGTIIWTGALYDVTQDAEREAALTRAHRLAEEMRTENERQALHDGLTALPNRRYYDQVFARRLEAARAGTGSPDCTLIRIDLDHFKYVNDTLGHEAGDRVLERVAQVLHESVRAADFAARIGGDEFSILLSPGTSPEEAQEIVERVQARLEEPLMFEGRPCRFGASFGIAHTADLRDTDVELQLFADAALYRAKADGRNRMEFFTGALHENILNDRRLAAEIQDALERDEFVPFFQPQVSAEDGRLVGVEALLRWRHPERGLVLPDSFMHVAAQLRLVPEIDRIMMEKSGEALDRLRHRNVIVPKISFNVSSGRMHDPDVVSAARAIATAETRVTFELLESILVEEESEAFKFHLDLVRDAGIDIEIDDFGSGHASIVGLMEILPSALKIDRRIVAPLGRDGRSLHLVAAIIEIANTLGIRTIAEGVETREQADILRDIGCDDLQGFLFSRPVDEAGLLGYVDSRMNRTA